MRPASTQQQPAQNSRKWISSRGWKPYETAVLVSDASLTIEDRGAKKEEYVRYVAATTTTTCYVGKSSLMK